MTTKIKLPEVTLCAMGSDGYRDSQQEALDYSSEGIEFGAVKNIIADIKSIDEWNKAIVFDLGSHIDTPYALLIHPDGFVVNPEKWNPDWLKYDYIGAPWPLPTDDYSYKDIHGVVRRVGNSVSLRSKKLLDIPKKLGLEWKSYHGNTNEDGYICVNMRHIFEEHDCVFAPLEVAKYFSHETMIPEIEGITPFAFHRHAGSNSLYPNFES